MSRSLLNLQHLSLSYNHLYDLKDYFQPYHWYIEIKMIGIIIIIQNFKILNCFIVRPALTSLDLSVNHFSNLKDLVLNKLKKLVKLKNLLLYGNPICVSLKLIKKNHVNIW